MKWIYGLLGLLFISSSVLAHEWYDYDCCDNRDCYPLDDTAELKELSGGQMAGEVEISENRTYYRGNRSRASGERFSEP
jgi:hypothetical protein